MPLSNAEIDQLAEELSARFGASKVSTQLPAISPYVESLFPSAFDGRTTATALQRLGREFSHVALSSLVGPLPVGVEYGQLIRESRATMAITTAASTHAAIIGSIETLARASMGTLQVIHEFRRDATPASFQQDHPTESVGTGPITSEECDARLRFLETSQAAMARGLHQIYSRLQQQRREWLAEAANVPLELRRRLQHFPPVETCVLGDELLRRHDECNERLRRMAPPPRSSKRSAPRGRRGRQHAPAAAPAAASAAPQPAAAPQGFQQQPRGPPGSYTQQRQPFRNVSRGRQQQQ